MTSKIAGAVVDELPRTMGQQLPHGRVAAEKTLKEIKCPHFITSNRSPDPSPQRTRLASFRLEGSTPPPIEVESYHPFSLSQ